MRRTLAQRGMTLIEVMIVLSIVGIVVGMALPKAAAIQESMQLESGAQQLMRELNLAQVRAIKENRTVSFVFESDSVYRIGTGEARPLPGSLRFGSVPSPIQFASFGPPLSGPATIQIVSPKGRARSLALNSSGYVTLQ